MTKEFIVNLRASLTAACVATLLFQQTVPAGEQLLRGGGLEGPFAGGLAAGWVKNCYGSNEVYTGGARGAMPWFSTMANGYYVLTDYDGRPKPTMMAYSAPEQQLDGATPRGIRFRNGLTVHLFSKGSGAVAVVWSEQQRTLAVEGARVLDLMGNEESRPVLRPGEPVFIVAPQLTAEQLDSRLK